jgi:AraC-like DNA-binding protein
MEVRMPEFETIVHPKHPFTKAFINSIQIRDWHWHQDFELILLLNGGITIQTLHEIIEMREGDFYLLHPRDIHRITGPSLENHVGLVQIDANFCTAYYPSFHRIQFLNPFIPNHYIDQPAELIRESMLALLRDSNRVEQNPLKHMAQINLLFYGCYELFAIDTTIEKDYLSLTQKQERVCLIFDYLQSHYDQSVTLADLANHIGLDQSYLSRYFKQTFQISFRDYLTKMRLNRAEFLLLHSDRSITDIAYDSGFSDLRTFNKQFQSEYQSAPKEFRSLLGKPTLTSADSTGTIEIYLPPEDHPRIVQDFVRRNSSPPTTADSSAISNFEA